MKRVIFLAILTIGSLIFTTPVINANDQVALEGSVPDNINQEKIDKLWKFIKDLTGAPPQLPAPRIRFAHFEPARSGEEWIAWQKAWHLNHPGSLYPISRTSLGFYYEGTNVIQISPIAFLRDKEVAYDETTIRGVHKVSSGRVYFFIAHEMEHYAYDGRMDPKNQHCFFEKKGHSEATIKYLIQEGLGRETLRTPRADLVPGGGCNPVSKEGGSKNNHGLLSKQELKKILLDKADLEKFLKEITFPLYADPRYPFICTGFNIKPSKSFVRMMAASAGHCEAMIKDPTRAVPYSDYAEDNPIFVANGANGPLDLMIFWKTSSGELSDKFAVISKETPEPGKLYYSLGMDEKDNRGLAILEFMGYLGGYLRFKYIGGLDMIKGTSGSPIVNDAGEVIAVSVAYDSRLKAMEGFDARATDIKPFSPLIDMVVENN